MCKSLSEPGGYRCGDPISKATAAAYELTAFIGATPFRPESAELLKLNSRPAYYDSEEWREYDDTIQLAAERHNIALIDNRPADGLWEGDAEPAGAYIVQGQEDDITAWAGEVAGRYNQDSVMVAFVDDNGPDTLYTFKQQSGINTAEALEDLKLAGIDGGRVVNGDLQILQDDNGPSTKALQRLQLRYGEPEFTPVRAIFVEKTPEHLDHAPIKEIQAIRQKYASSQGIEKRRPLPHMSELDDIAAAKAYEAAPHAPDDPAVKRSYSALRRHIVEQHNALTEAGYTFEPWHGKQEQPYRDSAEMLKDVRENKHLFFYRTEVSDTTEGALPANHPMAETVTIRHKDGTESEAPVNDVFRAVHDAFAHSDGFQFGPKGEKRAWWTHRNSLPRDAHMALWCETRAQNVWTNAGPHMQDPAGLSLKKAGADGWLPVKDRPYAAQKAVKVAPGFY